MWLGGKGTQPSEMKISLHPVQNKPAMTLGGGKEAEKIKGGKAAHPEN